MTKKTFTKHCLRCRQSKVGQHRHTPATFNTPCAYPGCNCTYFYGWDTYFLRHPEKRRELKMEDFHKKEGTDVPPEAPASPSEGDIGRIAPSPKGQNPARAAV